MSAILGGADSITVAPFDECYKSPDEASRRLARNTQIILKQEALLSRVADPGAGSYCLEVFTDFIAREGWKSMQGIEAAGGFRKARADGMIARALEQSLAAREQAVASRRRIFTGTNQYANLSEKALDRIEVSRLSGNRRGTQIYEQLRLRTERHAAKTGQTPRVLLAEIGDVEDALCPLQLRRQFLCLRGFRYSNASDFQAPMRSQRAMPILSCCAVPMRNISRWPRKLIAKLKALGRKTPVIIAGNPDSAEQLRSSRGRGFRSSAKQSYRSSYHMAAAVGDQGLDDASRFFKDRLQARGGTSASARESSEWLSPEHIPVKSFYTREDLKGLEHLEYAAGIPPYLARAVQHHVRHAALDHPAIRGLLHRGRVQRVLPAQSGRRTEGPFGRLRPCHASRIRLRSRARHAAMSAKPAWPSTRSST